MVLLDEAYTDYPDEPTLAALVKDNPNLVIAKTFSKIYGMAGAGIGYALANADTIKQLNDLQPWANAGATAVSLAGALASMEDHSFVKMSKTKNAETRNLVAATFKENKHCFHSFTYQFHVLLAEKSKKDLLSA